MKAYTPPPTYVRIRPVRADESNAMTRNLHLNLHNDNGTLKAKKENTEETVYGCNQDVNTTSAVAFNSLTVTNALTSTGAVTCISIDTGNGATEVYAMNQALTTTSEPTFNTINTGNGATFLHPMDQALTTTSDVEFSTIDIINDPDPAILKATLYVRANIYTNLMGTVSMTSMPTSSEIVGADCTQTFSNKVIDVYDNFIYQRYCMLYRGASTQTVTKNIENTVIFNAVDRSRNMLYGNIASPSAANSYIRIPGAGWYCVSFHTYIGSTTIGQYELGVWDNASVFYSPRYTTITTTAVSTRSIQFCDFLYFSGVTDIFVYVKPIMAADPALGHNSALALQPKFTVVFFSA